MSQMVNTKIDYNVLAEKALEVFNSKFPMEKLFIQYFDFYSYPQWFGTTSGPSNGIGGQAMTKFNVFAFVLSDCRAVLLCGKEQKYIDRFILGDRCTYF